MKLFIVFLILFMLSKKSFSDTTRSNFVRNYFAHRNIQQLVVFGCWDPHEQFTFIRDVMQLDTRISYAKIVDDIDMKRLLRVNYYRIGVVLDYDCPRSEIVFEKFSQHRLPFNESYHWLILSNYTTIPTDSFRHLPLTVETEMTFANRRENFLYVLHDIYNPSYRHNGSLNVTYKGSWTPRDGLNDQLTQYKYIRRGNFHGLALNFSIFLNHPPVPDLQTYMTTPINRHLDTMTRFHYALILQLRDAYNFTINLKRANNWGYLINGTWNGILAEMIDGLVDIGVSPFQYKLDRMDVCEYTVETYLGRAVFIFRHPKKSNVRNPFLTPFVHEVWYTIAAVGTLFFVILFLVAKVENIFQNNDSKTDSQLTSEIGLTILAAISGQGMSNIPSIISGRIVFISLFLWGVLLFQFYSASIVGSLLAEPPRFITTLKQLGDSNIDPWVEDIPYIHDFLRITTDPDVLEFYDKKIKPTKNRPKGSYSKNVYKGLNLVKRGGYAFNVETATAYKIITDTFSDDEICDLQEIELISPKKVMIVTAKKSPFKKMVIYGLRRIVQHGLTDALRKVWVAERPKCPDGHSSTPVPVQLEEFSPAIFFLLIGLTISICVIILEHCYHFSSKNEISRHSTPDKMFENVEDIRTIIDEDFGDPKDVP